MLLLTNHPSTPQAFAAAHAALAAWVKRRLTELTADPHAGEDLSQRTWLAVWEAVRDGRYDPQRAAMTTYVYAVSQNVFRNWARSRATSASHAPAIAAERATGAAPRVDPIEEAEVIDELRRALRDGAPGLTAGQLQALQLLSLGLTDRELARALAVAPSTAHARKREALDALRDHIERRFFTERPASVRKEQAEQP
ncbi:MAG: sigma-70 family RNA polymerase sigma factor [Phycisphaerales bacterium]|nr:sigma-70 family RNA polymerase sigma factor [Phycisphaerales bacterium]